MKFWTLFNYSGLAFENQTEQCTAETAVFYPENNSTFWIGTDHNSSFVQFVKVILHYGTHFQFGLNYKTDYKI